MYESAIIANLTAGLADKLGVSLGEVVTIVESNEDGSVRIAIKGSRYDVSLTDLVKIRLGRAEVDYLSCTSRSDS